MNTDHVRHLVCLGCRSDLVVGTATEVTSGRVLNGHLTCTGCARTYPIVAGIPRFGDADNYAASFGLEWTVHARTQYDSHTGLTLSADRLFAETGWSRTLAGEVVLEVGSGAGRFTEHAAATGAFVVSMECANRASRHL